MWLEEVEGKHILVILRGRFLFGSVYCPLFCCSSSSFVASSFPYFFSYRSWRACLNGFLMKLALSFSFLFLRFRMRSALRKQASFLLTSFRSTLRLSFLRCFPPSPAELAPILHQYVDLHLPSTFSWRMVMLLVDQTSQSNFALLIQDVPKRLSFLSTLSRSKCSNTRLRSVSSFCHVFTSLALGHLILVFRPCSLFSVCWVAGVLGGLTSACSHARGFLLLTEDSSSIICVPTTTFAPSALWFAPQLGVLLLPFFFLSFFFFPCWIRKPLNVVTFPHPQLHNRKVFVSSVFVPVVSVSSVLSGPSSIPSLGGPPGSFPLFVFIVFILISKSTNKTLTQDSYTMWLLLFNLYNNLIWQQPILNKLTALSTKLQH